jgi:hypothetical protein
MKFPLKRAAPLAGYQAIIPTRRLNQFFQEKIAADTHQSYNYQDHQEVNGR